MTKRKLKMADDYASVNIKDEMHATSKSRDQKPTPLQEVMEILRSRDYSKIMLISATGIEPINNIDIDVPLPRVKEHSVWSMLKKSIHLLITDKLSN